MVKVAALDELCNFTPITSLYNKEGFDIDFLKEAARLVDIPVIASGGAGSISDFVELFKESEVSAGLAASIFHNQEVEIKELKETLAEEGFEVKL